MMFDSLCKLVEENFEEFEIDDNTIIIICLGGYNIFLETYDDKYDIYADITPDYNHPIIEYENSLHRMAYVQWVEKRAGIEPEYESNYYLCSKFGFFELVQDETRVVEIINWLYEDEELNLDINNIDIDYFRKYYPDMYLDYKQYKDIYQSQLTDNISKDEWVHISDKKDIAKKFNYQKNDIIYINHKNTMICGIGLDTLKKVTNIVGEPNKNVVSEYTGLKYFFCKSSDSIAVLDAKLVNILKSIFDDMSLPSYYSIEYLLNVSGAYFIITGNIWGTILPVKGDYEIRVFEERNNLFYKLDNLRNFIPDDSSLLYYNLSEINYSDFEKLCYDLLLELGFKNIKTRGNSNAPDGGVDIEAFEEYETLLGIEKRYWVIQCKHTKSQVNRKDISEFDDLLKEFKADKFGLFYSGLFSPATLERIKSKSFVYAWDINEICYLLMKYPKVSKKYFGI